MITTAIVLLLLAAALRVRLTRIWVAIWLFRLANRLMLIAERLIASTGHREPHS